MKSLHCSLGFHDYYATYHPLILAQTGTMRVEDSKILNVKNYQYMTIKRICVRCKKKEEYIVQLSEKLQDWDVLLSAPNFVSEEWKKSDEE